MSRQVVRLAAWLCIMTGAAQSAIAADLPVKAQPLPAAVAAFTWTGIYVGGHVGYGWARKEWSDPFEIPPGIGSHNATGWLGGIQGGADYQIGNFVLGVEGQYSWADLKGDHVNPFDIPDILTTKVSSVATVAGRLGYAVDRVLFYAKGGGAWIRDKHTIVDLGIVEATASATRSGWLAGGGIEYAFWNNFSAKLEYNYMDFGTRRLSFTDLEGGPNFPLDIRQNLQTVTLGVNYRFGLFR